jgi:alkylation response protein AidB-like acyl-CoA dehydrogenase
MSLTSEATSDTRTIELIRTLSERFAERAETADQGGPLNNTVRQNINDLIAAGYLGAGIAQEYGGLGLTGLAKRTCSKLIAGACGVTAFTQQQLHAGGNFVGGCKDEELKQELLPLFASGKNICGVGFSHLRRTGPPKVKASRTPHGFAIEGVIPWISAWSILDSFILGATADDGNMIYCYLPIDEFRDHLSASEPMRLCTMEASETVELAITHLALPARYILSEHGPDHMVQNDFRNITGHIDMPIGCALGSARLLRRLGQKTGRQQLLDVSERIERLAEETESQAIEWSNARSGEPEYKANALKARVGAIKLAIDAAAASIAATGGSAHLLTNPAQRRFRESAFYATQAQTLDIQQMLMEAFSNG